jgi:hypothetical protein
MADDWADNQPMSRRFQFSLRDLLWLVFVIAGFLGGMAVQRRLDKPLERTRRPIGVRGDAEVEEMTLRDGTVWVHIPIDDE